ncbi:MAG: thioesterase family protein [Phocaeicola sp.]
MEIGLTHTSHAVVAEENTAATLGSGDLAVFATPAMVALMENAAMKAVAELLPVGSTTVGSMIEATHLKPSPLGASITATATLTQIEGRKLVFAIEARDEQGVIGNATHVRYVVDREKFMQKIGG